ncbi:MAG: glycosyltransferase family A protein [Phycisphaerales bacterium]|nr:glycosyltransferase family A protein [Phycisphaerales bacterium]
MSHKILVITPCHNEASFIGETIRSMAAQTLKAACWIIVDDGSIDNTLPIIERSCQSLDWIQLHKINRSGGRVLGAAVIHAFYNGLDQVDWTKYDYICKLDGDISLPEQYFEIMVQKMEADPKLGTCSGKAYYRTSAGYRVSEKVGDEMSLGAVKFYRRECFEQIGGFVPEVMWDGIDCHRCRMLGWRACSLPSLDLEVQHMRPMGSSDRGVLRGRRRHGAGQYFMGTGFVYLFLSAIYRLKWPPVIRGSLATVRGYLGASVRRKPRYPDVSFRKFLRRYQRRCIWQGKSRATESIDRSQVVTWSSEKRRTLSQRDLLS